ATPRQCAWSAPGCSHSVLWNVPMLPVRSARLRSTRRQQQSPPCLPSKDPDAYGTHWFKGKWLIYDQIFVSSGLLDGDGRSADPKSVQTINTLYRPSDKQRRPWRFGNERDRSARGYSDHFPVTVRLT